VKRIDSIAFSAVEGTSDLDSFALVHGNPPETENDRDWVKQVSEKYMKRFPFSHRPEIWFEPEEPFSENLEEKWWLKLGAVCIYGENLIPRIPQVKLETVVADSQFQRNYIIRIVDRVYEGAEQYPEPEGIKTGCRWICKRFLRAGMSLVMARAKVLTRDLYYCYEAFAKFYPQQDAAMWQALEYAINPTGNAEELLPLVKELGDFLAQEADAVFGAPQNS